MTPKKLSAERLKDIRRNHANCDTRDKPCDAEDLLAHCDALEADHKIDFAAECENHRIDFAAERERHKLECDALAADNLVLRETLQFYADGKHQETNSDGVWVSAEDGERARTALEKTK